MRKKKQNIPEPNLLTQRFAAGPPSPNQREGGGSKVKLIIIFILILAVAGLAAIQFVPINEEENKYWADAVAALGALEKNPLDKQALSTVGKAAKGIDDTEANREARTGLLTVYALGGIRAGIPGAGYKNCETIIQNYPETSFAKMVTKEKLFKGLSDKKERCPSCKGTGRKTKGASQLSSSKDSKKLGSGTQKCLSCGGTGKKKMSESASLDKNKVRAQYDEARSKTIKLASAKNALTKSSSLISKLQFFK